MQRRSAVSVVAAVLALGLTIAFIPQCSAPLPCCKAQSTAVLRHACCRTEQVTSATTAMRVTLPAEVVIAIEFESSNIPMTAFARTK